MSPAVRRFADKFALALLACLSVPVTIACQSRTGSVAPGQAGSGAGSTSNEHGSDQAHEGLPRAPTWQMDAESPVLSTWREQVVDSPERRAADRALDEIRRPAQLLAFLDLQPGMRIAELGAGGGYTSELLALATGRRGQIWAQNPPTWRAFVSETQAERSRGGRLGQVKWLFRAFESPLPEAAEDLDLVVAVLVYHDIANTPTDRRSMNQQIFDRLVPGGRFVVIDHQAQPHSGTSVAESLHRIESSVVHEELRAAGFEFSRSADFLGDDADAHDFMAFGRPVQPRTDRFVLEYRKPD